MPFILPALVAAAAVDYVFDFGWLRGAKDLVTYHHCATPVDAEHPLKEVNVSVEVDDESEVKRNDGDPNPNGDGTAWSQFHNDWVWIGKKP